MISSFYFLLCDFPFIVTDQRQVGETALNDKSSRSHQIIRLVWSILIWYAAWL